MVLVTGCKSPKSAQTFERKGVCQHSFDRRVQAWKRQKRHLRDAVSTVLLMAVN